MSTGNKLMEKQKDRLDRLLLNATSLLGLIFGISQVIIGGMDSLIFFIPFIILIWLWPIYIGYIRGAIILDHILERFRGWIYFIGGIFIYGCFSSVYYFRIKPGIDISNVEYLSIGIFILIIVGIIFVIDKKYFDFFDYKLSEIDKKILSRTYVNLITIGLISILYLITLNTIVKNSQDFFSVPMYIAVGFGIYLISLVLYFENSNKKLLKGLKQEPKYITKKGKDMLAVSLFISFIICFGLIAIFVYLFPKQIIYNLNLILFLMYLFLSLFYAYLLRTLDNKKINKRGKKWKIF